jgi:rhamnosyltransferase subunit B
MKILFPTLGSYGDVYPLLTLGQNLQQRGHEPVIVANPIFQSIVLTAGLDFNPLGQAQDYYDEINDPNIWNPVRGFQLVVEYGISRMIRPLYEIIRQFDPAETIIVSSAFLFASHIAHEAHGYRFCTFHLQPSLIRSVVAPPVLSNPALPAWTPAWLVKGYYQSMDRFFIDPLLAPVNDFRKELGLPGISRFFEQWIHSPQLNLGLFPDWFAPPQVDWPKNTRLTGFIPHQIEESHLSEASKQFIQAGEPPLVFTAGTAMLHANKFFENAILASQMLNRRAILLSRVREQIQLHLPENIHYAEFEPFEQLLPHCSAFIYHGGIGSLAQAMAAGVPQLVMPMSLDQPDNAARIKKLGVGDFIIPRKFKCKNVAEKLAALLNNPVVQKNCRQFAQRVDFETATRDTCDLIERFGQSNRQ